MSDTIPHGYKMTEVGIIPDDWEVKTLGSVITLQRGFDLPHRNRREGSIPVVTSSGNNDTHDEAKVKAPGVVTGRYGTIGEIFFIIQDFWPHNTTLFVNDFKGNDPLFIYYLLHRIDFKSYSGKSGVPGINRNDLHEAIVPIPTRVSEQRAIADALSDVDEQITALDEGIAKKRDIKQGAMQRLLTGEERLPGFSGEWEKVKIESIGSTGRGRVISHREISQAKAPLYPVYSSQTTNDGIMGYLDTYDFEGDYITWTTDGVNAGKVFYRTGRFNCTNVCGVIKTHSHDPKFIAFILDINTDNYVSKNLANPKLMNNVMKSITISIPPDINEQTAIATVLTDMDTEISILEAQREKTVALKTGMMQELFTGKTRLI